MTYDLERLLKAKYPLTFSKLFDPEGGRARHLEVESGWYALIHMTCGKLEPFGDMGLFTVKEKFGRLRFVFDRVPEEHREAVYAILEEAEAASGGVCEFCGSWSNTSVRPCKTTGWLKAICTKCSGESSFGGGIFWRGFLVLVAVLLAALFVWIVLE